MERAPRCPVCTEPLGVYEPLLAVSSTSTRAVSLAREPHPRVGEVIVHRACASAETVEMVTAGN